MRLFSLFCFLFKPRGVFEELHKDAHGSFRRLNGSSLGVWVSLCIIHLQDPRLKLEQSSIRTGPKEVDSIWENSNLIRLWERATLNSMPIPPGQLFGFCTCHYSTERDPNPTTWFNSLNKTNYPESQLKRKNPKAESRWVIYRISL